MERVKKLIPLICGAFCLWLLVRVIRHIVERGMNASDVVLPAVILALAIGLFLRAYWARLAFTALLLLAAIFILLAVTNPFVVMDLYGPGQSPPGIGRLIVKILPIEVLLLAIAWLLNPTVKKSTIKPSNPAVSCPPIPNDQ